MTAPERLDRFMARANAIYYATHDPFADFTTSPEISQVFGEILGLWAAITWDLLGRPTPIALVEAGPGRGTLMADALRAIGRAAPDFAAGLSVHLIETSRKLRTAQASRVPGATWHDDLATVPHQPLILLANEFLDALPIRQFIRRGTAWAERFVAEERWVERPAEDPDTQASRLAADGDTVELNPPAHDFVAALALRLTQHPGAALILDYGPMQSGPADTLQALAGKRSADPLKNPGSADLTAHVDFAALATTARAYGVRVQGPLPQGAFLGALGFFQRSERLSAGKPPETRAALLTAARRLTHPSQMGALFKAMALVSPGAGNLPGLPDAQ